jgi:hypothetical protein
MKRVSTMEKVERDRLADALLEVVPLEFMHALRDYKRQLMKCQGEILTRGVTCEELSSIPFLFNFYASLKGEEVKVLLHLLQSAREVAAGLDDDDFSFLVVWFLEGGEDTRIWWRHYENKVLLRKRKENKLSKLLKTLKLR